MRGAEDRSGQKDTTKPRQAKGRRLETFVQRDIRGGSGKSSCVVCKDILDGGKGNVKVQGTEKENGTWKGKKKESKPEETFFMWRKGPPKEWGPLCAKCVEPFTQTWYDRTEVTTSRQSGWRGAECACQKCGGVVRKGDHCALLRIQLDGDGGWECAHGPLCVACTVGADSDPKPAEVAERHQGGGQNAGAGAGTGIQVSGDEHQGGAGAAAVNHGGADHDGGLAPSAGGRVGGGGRGEVSGNRIAGPYAPKHDGGGGGGGGGKGDGHQRGGQNADPGVRCCSCDQLVRFVGPRHRPTCLPEVVELKDCRACTRPVHDAEPCSLVGVCRMCFDNNNPKDGHVQVARRWCKDRVGRAAGREEADTAALQDNAAGDGWSAPRYVPDPMSESTCLALNMEFDDFAQTRQQMANHHRDVAEAECLRLQERHNRVEGQQRELGRYAEQRPALHHFAVARQGHDDGGHESDEGASPGASTHLVHGSDGATEDEGGGPDGGAMQHNNDATEGDGECGDGRRGMGQGGVMRECVDCDGGGRGEEVDQECAGCGRPLHALCGIPLGVDLEQLGEGEEHASPDADVACVECACGWYPPCCVARYAACAWCLLFLVSSSSFSLLHYCHCSGLSGSGTSR